MKTKAAEFKQRGKVRNEKIRICNQLFKMEENIRDRESRVIERERRLDPMSPDELDEGRTVRKARKSW